MHVLLRRVGGRVNHKRVYRLYTEEGLALRRRRPRRHRSDLDMRLPLAAFLLSRAATGLERRVRPLEYVERTGILESSAHSIATRRRMSTSAKLGRAAVRRGCGRCS